jgi:Transposase DDE domain
MQRVLLLGFDVIDIWHSDLDGMNEGKEELLLTDIRIHSFVQLLGYMEVYFHPPYRQAEGVVVRAHANDKVPSVPDYSTIINGRINKLNIKISERIGNDIVIALDSTGIKITNRGEWLPHKWNIRKGYLKKHVVTVDIKEKKIVSREVTSEEIHDGNRLKNFK